MNSFIDWAMAKRKTIVLLFLFIVFAGTSSYINMPKEAAPDVQIPFVFVSTGMDGISPKDARDLLSKPIEQKVKGIDGLKNITSNSFPGGISIKLEFFENHNIDKALQDVRNKVSTINLPDDARTIQVSEFNLSEQPIIVLKLFGDVSDSLLYKTADRIKDAIEDNVPEVLKVELKGDREEKIEVIIDPSKLETYNLSFDMVYALFNQNNFVSSNGMIQNSAGEFKIIIPGRVDEYEKIKKLPIGIFDDKVIKFSDIATINLNYKPYTEYIRHNGQKAVSIEVSKRIGKNIINTTEKIKAVAKEAKKSLPQDLTIEYSLDQSDFIRDMLSELQNNIITAIILICVIIIWSMGVKTGILVGLAVPGAFLSGILIINYLGYTLNIVVLFGLIFAIGMLVDGAIIVSEYADSKMLSGSAAFDAYKIAAKKMKMAVFASIITILIVFGPLLFWPGLVGKFMKFLPITLIATLSSSFIVATIFIPVLGSFIKTYDKVPDNSNIIFAYSGQLSKLTGVTKLYIKYLKKALEKPSRVIIGCIIILSGVIFLNIKFSSGVIFFPKIQPDFFNVKVMMEGNLSIDEKDKITKKIENQIMDIGGIKSVYTTVGKVSGSNPKTISKLLIEMKNWQEREHYTKIVDKVNKIKVPKGAEINADIQRKGPAGGKDIEINVQSKDYDNLMANFPKITGEAAKIDGISNISTTYPAFGVEWQIDVDTTKSQAYGLSTMAISNAVNLVTSGMQIGKTRIKELKDETSIVIRYESQYRNIDAIKRITLQTMKGKIPIGDFITIKPVRRQTTIITENMVPTFKIKANIDKKYKMNEKKAEIFKTLNAVGKKLGLSLSMTGNEEQEKETSSFLGNAFLIAIAFVFITLITIFNSFFYTGVILTAIIFSTVGVLVGLLIHSSPFCIVMTGLGIIALAGIIVSNNIIFIDTFIEMREKCKSVKDAIMQTAAMRLRPIILTKITTMLGLIPIIMRLNIDFATGAITYGAPSSDWWVDLSRAIFYGILFASFLTLFFTPCALLLRFRKKNNNAKT